MTQSLHSFCRFHGLTKSTVHTYLTGRGFDLSQGMDRDAISAAREKFLGAQDAPVVEVAPLSAGGYSDPFAGVTGGGAMVPAGFSPQSRALATNTAAQRVQSLCQGANSHTAQTVWAALESGDQIGAQLGALIAERTITAAENQRQALMAEYLESHGVSVGKPQQPAS